KSVMMAGDNGGSGTNDNDGGHEADNDDVNEDDNPKMGVAFSFASGCCSTKLLTMVMVGSLQKFSTWYTVTRMERLQRYRSDRRKLLEFLLSSGLFKELRTPSGPTTSLSALDFDSLSADYILHSLKSGGVIDVTEATSKFSRDSSYPVAVESKVASSSYYLVTDPDASGSPPRRVAPPLPPPPTVDVNRQSDKPSGSSSRRESSSFENGKVFEDKSSPRYKEGAHSPRSPLQNADIPDLGLPSLNTGLSEDDLRETAYELLLATLFLSGVEECGVDDRKKEKSSKLLSALKTKKEKARLHSQPVGRHAELLNTIRVQMQISEPMDACTRRNFMQLAARKTCGQIDLPNISLGLLNGTLKSDFPNEKSYVQWKSRQANLLEELLCSCPNIMISENLAIKSYVAKIKDAKAWDSTMSPSERVAVLASIRQLAVKLSSSPGKFGLQGETIYWTCGYHLNLRLYQKLLCGVFDILDEDQLIEEADEFLLAMKLTWPTLGITQRMHNALYGWVLFQQFSRTDGTTLLENAVLQLQKLLSACEDDQEEGQYMNSLKPDNFKTMMTLVSALGVASDDSGKGFKLVKLDSSNDGASRKLKIYVTRSIKAACSRAAKRMEYQSRTEKSHHLALLAEELKLIAEREFNVFFSVFCHWCPESLMMAVVMLHQFYGERLKPFLNGVSSLSEDVRSVLPAAAMLDQYLTYLYTSALDDNKSLRSFRPKLDHYQIGEVSRPLIIDWVISQHAHIMEWTGRAFDIEEWEPLSYHQRQAASIVEVFRIIEETVDQFFGLNLPMDITHLQALLSIIFHSLDAYLLKLLDQLVEKNHLYPTTPPLTRYTESVLTIMKKRLLEYPVIDGVSRKLNELTIPKLCIRLNTLQYIEKQISVLEDGIRKSWALIRPPQNQRSTNEPQEERSFLTGSEAVDALFATTFNIIKDTTTDLIDKICDFIGARVVFWDLRHEFLFHLYRGDVAAVRLESFLPHVDTVLDLICGLIDDTLRDSVVLSVCRAMFEGFIWVLLDGGPSRAFSDTDFTILAEDFDILKEFFIADGEGLPRTLVEQESNFARQILGLFSLQTETIIQMLMKASEHIATGLETRKHAHMRPEDAYTLVRVLCHKKDREASKFLKMQYQLPMSSEYDDTPSVDSASGSPFMPDLLKRSASFHWNKKGRSSFKSMKKKLQEATSEIRNMSR
ncbi:hypothetical protein Tsubulata_019697, partial [Turnera subulata]